MHPLIIALGAWPGRRATKSFLEAKGYMLPDRYKDIVLANCDSCDGAALERYWDEAALEYFCAAGRVRSNQRKFGGETSYRSEYLDRLASLATNRDAVSRGLPLDHGLQAFMAGRGSDFWQRITEEMERHKRAEIERFGISVNEDTRTKMDFSKLLHRAAEAKGFVIKNGKWRKTFAEALEFCCFIDSGMSRTWAFQLPLQTEIIHRSAPDLVFLSPLADILVPGFNYYQLYQSPEGAVLGIEAHIDLFNTIGELIVSKSRSAA